MKHSQYYMLLTSLPHLKKFDQLDRVPITREALLQRLSMLEPDDMLIALKAADFLSWIRQPVARSNKEMAMNYKELVQQIFGHQTLKEIFELPVNIRTLMAALRHKMKNASVTKLGENWGVGPLVRNIEHHWNDAAFNLAYVYPWILEADAYLKSGESLKLEYLLMNLMWNTLDRHMAKNYFGFEAVLAYLLKWDIIQQWTAYNKQSAKIRFEQLVDGVINDSELARSGIFQKGKNS